MIPRVAVTNPIVASDLPERNLHLLCPIYPLWVAQSRVS